MALHDYQCAFCGEVVIDYYVPVTIGAFNGAPRCVVCGNLMDWVPQVGRMDFGPSGGTGFKGFTIEETDQRGQVQQVEIDSMHKLRQVERESEIRARNGEGRPLVWRDYAQNRTNTDVHTLARPEHLADPHQTVATRAAAKATITPRRGKAVTDAHGTI